MGFFMPICTPAISLSEPQKGSYLELLRKFDIDAPAPLPPDTQFANTTIWNLADGHRPNLDFLNANGSKQ